MSEATLDPCFSQYIVAKQVELEAISFYIGKVEAQKILTLALQEICEVTTTAMISDPFDYILLVAKLIEHRKKLMKHRQKLEVELRESLTLLEAKLGEIPVSDRLAAWLVKYRSRTNSEMQSVSQILDISTIEKLINSLKSLL